MKALVWPVATYGCESWTLRKNEETRLDAFEMKGLRKTAGFVDSKEKNEWVLKNDILYQLPPSTTIHSFCLVQGASCLRGLPGVQIEQGGYCQS